MGINLLPASAPLVKLLLLSVSFKLLQHNKQIGRNNKLKSNILLEILSVMSKIKASKLQQL